MCKLIRLFIYHIKSKRLYDFTENCKKSSKQIISKIEVKIIFFEKFGQKGITFLKNQDILVEIKKTTMNQISDEAILEGIKLKSQFIVSYLYEEFFSGLLRFIIANSGSEEDAEDIFQEALIVVYQKTAHPDFELTSSFKNYFYGVSKVLWLRKISGFSLSEESLDNSKVFTSPEIAEDDTKRELQIDKDILKHGLYQKYFLQLGAECQEILKLSMKKVSIKEISEKTGFTPNYVKTRKSMCRKKLIELIKTDPQYKNYFEYEK